MIGLVEQVLTKIILDNSNEETLHTIYEKAGIEKTRVFQTNQYYDEAEFRKFLTVTLEVLNLDVDKALTIFADEFFKYTKSLYPTWYGMASSAHDFLLLQVKIHDGFGHSLKDKSKAKTLMNKIKVEEIDEKYLKVRYQSENQLCGLYIKLAERVGAYYGDIPTLTQSKCMHNGDKECEIHVKW